MFGTLELIEKSLLRGGQNLTAKDIVGTGKSSAAALAKLVNDGVFEKTGARYSLTAAARQLWETDASPERKSAILDHGLEEFLRCVESRSGKSLTAKDLAKHSALIEEAERRALVEPGAKANSYMLSPKGKEFLLARLPVAEQIARLKVLHAETMAALSALTNRVSKELASLSGQLQIVAAGAYDEGQKQLEALAAQIDGLALQGEIARLGVKTQEEVSSKCRAAVAWMDAQTKKLQGCQQQVQSIIDEQNRRLAEQGRMIQSRLVEIEERLALSALRAANARPGDSCAVLQAADLQDVAALQEAIVQRVQEQHREDPDAPITLGDLLCGIQGSQPTLTLASFHDALRALYEQDRVRLMPYTRPLATIPDNNALFVNGEVMYYVRPG
jgi:hypothetical protein